MASTQESYKSYITNKKQSETTNECFWSSKGTGKNFRKMSDFVPPSKVGKPNNFFNLREQLSNTQRLMPTKNKVSTSFAVSEDKVARKKFSFGDRTEAFAQVRNMSALEMREKYTPTSTTRHQNRHVSRTGAGNSSVDIVFHTAVKGPRQASDG